MDQKNEIFKLIAEDGKFEKLASRLTEFNPLKILKVQDYEIRHSNFLGWLLDPSQNHNLDGRVLVKFLFKTLISSFNSEKNESPVDMLKLYQNNLNDVKVYREYKNIDILIVSELSNLVIIIENKVYAKEHSNQLLKYIEIVEKDFNGKSVLPIFLTLDGQIPSVQQYYIATYNEVIEIIESVVNVYRNRMANDVYDFIKFYIKAVKEKLGMDRELVDLCKDIYRNHKAAIDLIYTHGRSDAINEAFELFVQEHNIENYGSQYGMNYFVLPEIEKKIVNGWFGDHVAVVWFSKYTEDALQIVLEIGPFPFNNGEQRIRFIEHGEAHNLKFSKSAKKLECKFSRACSKRKKITNWDDKEQLLDAMSELYDDKAMQASLENLKSTINSFEW